MGQGLCSLFVVIGQLRGMSGKRVCYTFDVHFGSQEEKAAFVCRLKRVRELASPEDDPPPKWFSSRGIIIYNETEKHLQNEQRSRDAAAKKRANTSGVGKINNYCEDIYIYTYLHTTTPTNHTYTL